MEEENIIDMYAENYFEPLKRTRSNTWPLPRPEGHVDGSLIDGAAMTGNTESIKIHPSTQRNSSNQAAASSTIKRKLPRRNAWGSLSYAELIIQAINSSKDQRLTLAQIYEWIVKNVQYFKDKGGTSSSAGWKNSVRHNLSLHNCFMRMPNEDSGKSSWWMVNSDAKFGKTTRKRASTMEAGKLDRRRNRAKRHANILRKTMADVTSSAPSSKGVDMFQHHDSPLHHRAQQFPAFQPRISSSASSCGRLSSVPAANESELHTPMVVSLAEHQPIVAPIHQINQTSQLDHIHLPVNYQMEQREAPINDFQNVPANFNVEYQENQMCPVHQLDVCNCNLSTLQMQTTSTDSSCVYYETNQPNHYFDATYENQYGVMTSPATLMPIQEVADFGSIVDLQLESQPMVRNNSMLDDINEIISKDQDTAINLVNNSMSTALYISGNNRANPVGQCSWIHS